MNEVTVGLFGHPWKLKNGKWPEELNLEGKKILSYLLDRVSDISDDFVVIASSEAQASIISSTLEEEVGILPSNVVINPSGNILEMTLSLLDSSKNELLLVLPTSSPFIPTEVLTLLVDLLEGRDGVFIRDKLGNIYKYLFSLRKENSKEAILFEKKSSGDLKDVPVKLKKTMVISWHALSSLDPLNLSFFSVSSEEDLRSAKKLLAKVKSLE